MVDLGLVSERDALTYRERPTVNHASKLIRFVARRAILPVHADDVFFVTYLKGHPRARGIDFPEDRDGIEEGLAQDEKQ